MPFVRLFIPTHTSSSRNVAISGTPEGDFGTKGAPRRAEENKGRPPANRLNPLT
jgi:hypothetical protein